jgi:hypothetical protein
MGIYTNCPSFPVSRLRVSQNHNTNPNDYRANHNKRDDTNIHQHTKRDPNPIK